MTNISKGNIPSNLKANFPEDGKYNFIRKLAPTCLITFCQDPEEHDISVVFRHSDVQFMSTERRRCRTEEEYRLDQEHLL